MHRLAAAAILLGGAVGLFAQEEPVVFRSDVSLARIDAQVLDRNRRPITTLRREDFVIREGGELREISSFSREDMPLDVLILLDVSGSMRPHVEQLASATREALLVLSRKDRVAIMVFDRKTRLSMPFRSNQDEIVRGMEAVLNQEDFNGGTDITRALYDAASFMQNNGRREARRAIVILTDDRTERNRDVQGVGQALENSNTVLSALITPDAFGRRGGIQIPTSRRGGGGGMNIPGTIWDDVIFGRRMPTGGGRFPGGGGGRVGGSLQSAGTAEIARASGGDSMDVNDASALEAALEKIRQSYALFFHASEGSASRTSRSVEVNLTSEAASRYPGAEVNYRRSYQLDNTSDPVSSAPAVRSERREPPVASEDDPPTMKRRRPAVDEPSTSRGPAPGAATTPAAKEGDEAAAQADEQPKGGFRRLKPGEKP